MIFLAPFALAACLSLPTGAAVVTAGDLHLEGLPPETTLSLAPAPGIQRVFHDPELRQIAARFHLAAIPDDDVCVERSMAPIDPAKLLAAMRQELPGAKIEILEYSQQPAPDGDLAFHRAALRNNTAAGATWFGVIRYAPNRDFTIWAKVKVTERAPRVVALNDLPAGKPIQASQVKVETRDEFPDSQPMARSLEEALGRYPRVAIRAGSEIRMDALEAPKDIRQGDIVQVEVRSGNARLSFDAVAAGSGCVGDSIAILNPSSAKRFQARIRGKGKVSVDATAIP